MSNNPNKNGYTPVMMAGREAAETVLKDFQG